MNYPTLSSMSNMYKDLELAKQELQKSGTNLPVFEQVDELFKRGVSLGKRKPLVINSVCRVASR